MVTESPHKEPGCTGNKCVYLNSRTLQCWHSTFISKTGLHSPVTFQNYGCPKFIPQISICQNYSTEESLGFVFLTIYHRNVKIASGAITLKEQRDKGRFAAFAPPGRKQHALQEIFTHSRIISYRLLSVGLKISVQDHLLVCFQLLLCSKYSPQQQRSFAMNF